MIELESPQIEPVEEVGTYAKYEVGPLQAGYGVTLGNALRRVLLSSLEGAAAWIGRFFPATYFITLSRGVFSKALGFSELQPELLALAPFGPLLTLLTVALLRKQGR